MEHFVVTVYFFVKYRELKSRYLNCCSVF